MKRTLPLVLLITFLLVGLPAPAPAGGLEDALESRWLGAWVVTQVETYSDCMGVYTNNRVNGRLVSSRSGRRFKPGELAKVEKVDAKRSRLDLHLTLQEPLLVSRQDGPFTLYDEARCHIELEVELPRKLVSKDDVNGIERALSPILVRFNTVEEAQQSQAWNRRQREPYPKDYERTLAEHAAWRAQQTNAAVQARLDRARDEAARVGERLSGDDNYLGGFARGVEAARAVNPGGCRDMLTRDLRPSAVRAPQGVPQALANLAGKSEEGRWASGYQDGQILFFSLDMLRRLPQCFVPVPEVAGAAPSRTGTSAASGARAGSRN